MLVGLRSWMSAADRTVVGVGASLPLRTMREPVTITSSTVAGAADGVTGWAM
jgi:hypothetical protein